jgi:predicted class III extradiol MEMO1 family dioxygenase
MDILSLPENDNGTKVLNVHAEFAKYLERTRNTICGRHPIGVLLGALTTLSSESAGSPSNKSVILKWVKYDHSSECETLEDSSVSYASAYVVF